MRDQEKCDVAYVILGIFIAFSILVIALLDPSSTHSYVFYDLVQERNILVEDLEIGVRVSSRRGLDVLIDKVHCRCPVELHDDGTKVVMTIEISGYITKVVFAVRAQRLLSQGWVRSLLGSCGIHARLYSNAGGIRTVQEFSDIFSNELPGLPPDREVEFSIKVFPGSTLVSITPYHMAQTKLKELKNQIHELLGRGFIRSSISP
ncbi:uncharacterized protein LOC120132878 [Hibiscus syriacus]|uniref:uncharacterized protein LOC120132878 n=1 Tax=Hibiscus syriacus TaxID=106335 RepID=UPI001921DEF2|nr:uncharacterized protein LOC120132878 [Hibiscus syriacus]